MSKGAKILTNAVLSLAFLAIVACPVQADVTGQFAVDVDVIPQSHGQERSPAVFDVRPMLDVQAQISGLTLGINAVAGLAGLENAIFGASATLGSVDLRSDTAFAMPFRQFNTAFSSSSTPINDDLLFVSQRLELRSSLFGARLTNRLIYEDTNFEHPFPSSRRRYTAQSQAFAVGNIVTIQGRLDGGVRLRLTTGLGADPNASTSVKGQSFNGSATSGQGFPLVSQTLAIRRIQLATATLGISFEVRRTSSSADWKTDTRGNVRLPLGPGNIRISLASPSDSVFPLQITSASFSLRNDPLSLRLALDETFEVQGLSTSTTLNLSPRTSTSINVRVSPITQIETFSTSFLWSGPNGTTLTLGASGGSGELTSLSTSVRAHLNSAVQLSANFQVQPNPATMRMSFRGSYSF